MSRQESRPRPCHFASEKVDRPVRRRSAILKLAAFPKCFVDELCLHRTMSVFDWIDRACDALKPLGVSGLEMYPGFLTRFDAPYLADVKSALNEAGFEMPMFCASPDFTSPDPAHRAAEIEKERRMIDVSAALGG